MCGIVPFVKTLYEDLMDAVDDLFPKHSNDTAPPLINNRQSLQPVQPHQRAYTSTARPVAERQSRAAKRREIGVFPRLPSPPRGPPTR
ncbi:hypothetical protein F66182_3542 [Fusarium sp. NRRL 66182]|nr:hypothetical protein F66182_3542 [Fusarium sp. NRRL 66182]